MRRIAALATAVAALAITASPVAAATKTVTWGFGSSGTISIKKGDKITFRWTSGGHNVAGSGWSSGSPKQSGSYTKTFSSKGSFSVYCAPHSSVMKVTVKVS